MLADAMEIADSCARADIESYCHAADKQEGDDYRGWWWDVDTLQAEERSTVDQALRYLDARGHIEYRAVQGKRHVRFKQEAVA